MAALIAWLFRSKNLKKRAAHRTVSVGDSLYVWAGDQDDLPEAHDSEEKRRITSNIQHFTPSTGQWITRDTTGTPPLGVRAYCCTAINDQLYYFGGYCGHDDCYHNSITQLDTISLQWRELEPTDATRPVMMRGYGGMISFEHDGVHHLLMIGGLGSKPAIQLPHYKYDQTFNGNWRTNEHSMYNLSSRKWSNPSIIGQCIPPANSFIIEKINNTRAVLFGGLETDDDAKTTATNHIYILEISISTVFWQCIKKPEAIDQWPVGRCLHAGAVIVTGSDCPMLVISGGEDKNEDTLDDCWIFNITQHSWIKLDVPHSVTVSKRFGHSLSVFIMSPHCVWIITTGGCVDKRGTLVTNPNIVMLTELVTKGEWTVGDTLDTNGMNNEEYKKKYQQQLQTGRRIWLEEYQKPRKGDTADIEQTVQALMKSLEEKEREAQVYHQQLEQKEREEAEKDQEIRRYCHQLQEKDKELRQSQEAVRRDQQQALTDDHWVINKDEVTLTKEELGKGSYGFVT
uniref:Attractin/MKLN-like beta-propeller domain-containing protein n=1 Tax=Amphimedon queenslandica TaxID=400682 RepID=A0A1X7SWV7_AMPQE